MIIKTEYISLLHNPLPERQMYSHDGLDDETGILSTTPLLLLLRDQNKSDQREIDHNRTIHAIPSRAMGSSGIEASVCVADEVVPLRAIE